MQYIYDETILLQCSVDLPEPCYDRDFMNEKLVDEEITWLTGQSQGIGCVLDLDNPSSLPIGKNYKVSVN